MRLSLKRICSLALLTGCLTPSHAEDLQHDVDSLWNLLIEMKQELIKVQEEMLDLKVDIYEQEECPQGKAPRVHHR